MKKLLFIWLVGVLVFFFESCNETRQAKYVFYFIGDGMGVNQVNGTEMYLAELDSVVGVKGVEFCQFPDSQLCNDLFFLSWCYLFRCRRNSLGYRGEDKE